MDIRRWQRGSGGAANRWAQGRLAGLAMLLSVYANAELVLSTEVFTSGSHQQTDNETTNSLQLGNTTTLGYSYTGGPHRFITGYNYTLDRIYFNNNGYDTSLSGNTRYLNNASPRFDFNLGHSARAVSAEDNLIPDLADYELRHTVTGGAGLNSVPTGLNRVRVETQATQTLDENLDRTGHQLTGQASASRQLSKTQSASLTIGRSIQWDAESVRASTTDSAQLGFQSTLPNGSASGSLGVSFYTAGNTERTLLTAAVSRNWVTGSSQTSLAYNRATSNTLTELSLQTLLPIDPDNPPQSIDDLETETEVVTEQQISLVDTVRLNYRSQSLCERCVYQLTGSLSTQESLTEASRSYTYTAGTNLNYKLTRQQNLTAAYQWQANADKLVDGPERQQHRVNLGWDRRLSSQIQVRASLEHGWQSEADNRRTTARLGIRIGLIN